MTTRTCRNGFPFYLIDVDGMKKFVPLSEAGVLFDSGWGRVEFGGLILEKDFFVRPMNPEERQAVSDAADRNSSSK